MANDYKIYGVEGVLRNLENKLGSRVIATVSNKALKKAGQYGADKLQNDISYFKRTGATVDEVVLSRVRNQYGERLIDIGWEGPMERWRLVHLNEFGYNAHGTFNRITPAGYGAVQKSMNDMQNEVKEIMIDVIKKELGL